jgi:hypothetical protein
MEVSTASPSVSTVAPVERKVEALTKTNFEEAEFKISRYSAIIPIGTFPEDLLMPEYWAHVTAFMRPWQRIEAHSEDGTWFAEYIVLSVDRAWARVRMLGKYNLTSNDVALSQAEKLSQSGFEVKWRGAAKWSVIRTADSAIMKEHMDREEADIALKQIEKDQK